MLDKIIEAVQNLFSENYPELEAIYMEEVKDGLERPSVFIDYKFKPEPLNKYKTKVEVKFNVLYFIQEDRAKTKGHLSVIEVEKKILELSKSNLIYYEDLVYRFEELETFKSKSELAINFTVSREENTELETSETINNVEFNLI